jgi:hypothetical protein
MIIQLYTDLQTHEFEVNKETSEWIQAHLDKGRKFDVLFPDFEESE